MSRNTPWRTARRMYALHQPGHNDWYRIRNQIEGPTQVHIYDEIGYFGVGAADFIRDMADVNGPIEVHLNSPGGEVFDGIAIYNALMARKDVTVMVDGIAASIASVIAMAGNPVLMARQSSMMVHDGFAQAIGNAQDLRDLAEQLDRVSNQISEIYSEHTGKPPKYWREVMKAESWFGAQEAVDAGLADRFIDSGAGRQVQPPSDTWDMSAFKGAASVPYVGERQTRHETMTGTHRHDHAAYEASDHDDGQHVHNHSHHNDADHDHADQHTAGAGGEGGGGNRDMDSVRGSMYEALFTEIRNWNASAALSSCHSAGDYRKVCAGERASGDPDTQSHWALPHHASPGSGPDKGGVVAALGRWNQTDGLKNKEAALSHLKAHARALGLPSGDDNDGGGKSSNLATWDIFGDDDVSAIAAALKGA